MLIHVVNFSMLALAIFEFRDRAPSKKRAGKAKAY